MAAPFCLRPVRARHHVSNISAFKVRKAVRTLARMCDVPYHRQPLTPQLRHHMAASVAQLVEHRSRKAGVTGSSPVAGSIAQDSRLRAAFLLPISDAHPPIQAQRRRQLPYSTKSPANRGLPNGKLRSAGPKRAPPRDNARNTNNSAEQRATPASKRRQAA